jgi:hypothetical protein
MCGLKYRGTLTYELMVSRLLFSHQNARRGRLMRIQIIQRPTIASIDGLELDRFEPGCLYEVGTTLGMLLLAEGWARPIANESKRGRSTDGDPCLPPNLIIERPILQPRAADVQRRRRPRRTITEPT